MRARSRKGCSSVESMSTIIVAPCVLCSPTASLSTGWVDFNAEAPTVSFYSSTGPVINPALPMSVRHLSNDILKPDILGPGTAVWGAWKSAQIGGPAVSAMVTGTSMATPHVAGKKEGIF